ncbi:MAG: glycosyltransferase [Tenericutes bacterium]|nr:glycosyltransferase [Mycoplasmatota bacterium]
MYIAFLNPQGNFDKNDSFWTEHPDFGGQLVYVKEMALALGKMGHNVDIITRKFTDNKLNVFDKNSDSYLDVDNVRIIRLSCGGNNFLQKELLWEHLNEWTNNIVNFFKKQKRTPDFITGHYGDGGLSATMLKQKLNIPYSFTGHSLGAQKLDKLGATKDNIQSLEDKYFFSKRIEAERTAIKYADTVFVSTKQEKAEQYTHALYNDISKDSMNKFVVAPPGANTDVFNEIDSDFDKDYKLKFDKILKRDILESRLYLPYIILASRLDPKKNHIGLLKAYANDKSLQKRTNIAISLRGIDNAYEDYSDAKSDEIRILNEMMKVIQEFRLQGKITFISIRSQKELASFYRYMAKRKSIFCLTALYEPFGLAPIEAMSSGLPAVVTKYGGPSDVLYENRIKYGVLVDVFDLESISRGLHEALDNYREYKRKGIQRVLENYTWDATAKKYMEAITKIIKKYSSHSSIHIHEYFIDSNNNKITSELIKNI